MASHQIHEDKYDPLEKPEGVKEEKVEIVDNKPCCTTGKGAEDDVDQYIKTLSYDEIVSLIEIVKQLQNALKPDNENEGEEVCSKSDREIKQEKEYEGILSVPKEFLEKQESDIEVSNKTFKLDCDKCYRDVKDGNSDHVSPDIVSNRNIGIFGLQSSERETRVETSTAKYISIHTMQNNAECSANSFILARCTNNSKANQEKTETVCIQNCPIGAGITSEEYILGTPSELACGSSSNYTETERQEVISFHQANDLKNSPSLLKLDTIIEKPFDCKECGAKFNKRFCLKRHMRIHTDDRPFICNICGSKFRENSKLKRHMSSHIGKEPLECNTCGSKFSKMSYLKRHMTLHCKICEATFTLKSNLKQHLITHKDKQRFECNACGSKFIYRCLLKKHMRIHTRDNPFLCNICGAAFTLKANLKQHLAIHTCDKPFECKTCGSKFSHTRNLKQHMRIHTDNKAYECKVCGVKFTFLGSLKYHENSHRP